MPASSITSDRSQSLRQALALTLGKLKRNPADGRLLDEAAVLLYQLGQVEAAAQTAEAAAAARPGDPLVQDHFGLILLAAGRASEALTAARRAAALAPRNGAIALNLGNALLANGDATAAATVLTRASTLLPREALVWFNLGNALAQTDRRPDAVAMLRKALALAPDLAAARRNLALLLRAEGKPAEAAATLAPLATADDPDVLHLLGALQLEAGDPTAALAPLRRVAALRPDDPGTSLDLARALVRLSRFAEATAACGIVVKHSPENPVVWNLLGLATAEPEAAASHFRRALAFQPGFADAAVNLSRNLVAAQQTSEALEVLDAALRHSPDQPELHSARAVALLALDQVEQALDANTRALAVKPDQGAVRLNKALCELRLGDYTHGWADYEARWTSDAEPPRYQTTPAWPADCPRKGHLLVWNEQGVGDEVMFSTLLRALRERVDRITVSCAPRLLPLFARSFPEIAFVAQQADRSLPDPTISADWQIAAGSLPARLWRESDHPGGGHACLVADPVLTAVLHTRYRTEKRPLVGLSWRTTNPRNGAERSIAPAEWAAALRGLPARFLSLQYGDTAADLATAATAGLEVAHNPEIDCFGDLDGFAALVASVDAVLTIDNSTVHFAGALGRPTWLLVPTPADWRWRREMNTTPWYETVRIHRRAPDAPWSAALTQAAADLAAFLQGLPS